MGEGELARVLAAVEALTSQVRSVTLVKSSVTLLAGKRRLKRGLGS